MGGRLGTEGTCHLSEVWASASPGGDRCAVGWAPSLLGGSLCLYSTSEASWPWTGKAVMGWRLCPPRCRADLHPPSCCS